MVIALKEFFKGRRLLCNIAAAAVAVCLVAPVVFQAFDKRVSYLISDGITVPAQIEAGGNYSIEWTAVSTGRRCDHVYVSQNIVDSQGKVTFIAAWNSYFEPDKFKTGVPFPLRGNIRIMPDSVSPGAAEINLSSRFYCNSFQWFMNKPVVKNWDPISTIILPNLRQASK